MNTQTIYYWQSGAWVDDRETAELAVECLGFADFESVELDIESDVDSEIMGLVPQPKTV